MSSNSINYSSIDPTSLKAMGKRIRLARSKKELTQWDLAEQLHVSMQAVSGWERGINSVNNQILPKLASLLEITTDFLLTGSLASVSQTDVNSMLENTMPHLSKDEAYQANIFMRTLNAPDDIKQLVKKAFHTQEPLQEVFRLLIDSYCSQKRLCMENYSFAHILSIIPYLEDQSEINTFIDIMEYDPDIYMIYALAPYVNQLTLDSWIGVCDFRHDYKAAASLMPLLSSTGRMTCLERIIDEAPSPEIAKEFADYLTEEIVSHLLSLPSEENVASSLYGLLTKEQIKELIERCDPYSIPNLAYYIPQDYIEDTIQLLMNRCPKDLKSSLINFLINQDKSS